MTCGRAEPDRRSILTAFLSLAYAMAAPTLRAGPAQAATSGRLEPQSLTKEIRKTVTINYLLYLPRAYGEDKDRRWPVILFLHGAGERGSDLERVKAYGPPRLVAEGKEMPFIIVSPQIPERSTWDPEALERGGWLLPTPSGLRRSLPSAGGETPAWRAGWRGSRYGCFTAPRTIRSRFRRARKWSRP